jgi:predicted ATPase
LRASALTSLVGRDEEIDLLLRRWARAKVGDGQVVMISGEPGIGKPRIVAVLAERLRDEPHLRLRHCCSPYHQDSALYPFIDQLGRASGFSRNDPPQAKLKKLEALLVRAAATNEDWPSSPICCHCRLRSATLCPTSARSAKRNRHSKR